MSKFREIVQTQVEFNHSFISPVLWSVWKDIIQSQYKVFVHLWLELLTDSFLICHQCLHFLIMSVDLLLIACIFFTDFKTQSFMQDIASKWPKSLFGRKDKPFFFIVEHNTVLILWPVLQIHAIENKNRKHSIY